MQKLIDAYRRDPSLTNAQRIRSYERKHMMSTALLSPADADLVADAIHHANTGGH